MRLSKPESANNYKTWLVYRSLVFNFQYTTKMPLRYDQDTTKIRPRFDIETTKIRAYRTDGFPFRYQCIWRQIHIANHEGDWFSWPIVYTSLLAGSEPGCSNAEAVALTLCLLRFWPDHSDYIDASNEPTIY